jgi:hypothetical protein
VVDVATRDLIPSSLWFELKQSNGFTRFLQVRYEMEGGVSSRPPSDIINHNLIGAGGGSGLRAPTQPPFPPLCSSSTVTGQPSLPDPQPGMSQHSYPTPIFPGGPSSQHSINPPFPPLLPTLVRPIPPISTSPNFLPATLTAAFTSRTTFSAKTCS